MMMVSRRLRSVALHRREWSLPKFMFIFARYYALFHVCLVFAVAVAQNIPIKFCAAYIRINGFGTQVLAYFVDGLLILRLHSVYGKKRAVTIPLVLLYIGALASKSPVGILLHASTPIPSSGNY